MSTKYWLQQRAPAGNWVDRMGSDDLAAVVSHYTWCRDNFLAEHRVVERTDVEIPITMFPTKEALSHELAVKGFADTDDAAAWLVDNFEIRRK
jgi:hypothetical protein